MKDNQLMAVLSIRCQNIISLTLSLHAIEGYSSHFVCLSACLSVSLSLCLSVSLSVADLEDGGLLALQRDTNLKSMTI